MTFRKDSLLFYQSEISLLIVVVLCVALTPYFGLSLFYALPISILLLVNPKWYTEMITINEAGIRCQKSDKQIWAYEWNCIAELKRGSRFLLPSIEVITYSKNGKSEQFALPDHYFQLGSTAKKALKQYYHPKDISQNEKGIAK